MLPPQRSRTDHDAPPASHRYSHSFRRGVRLSVKILQQLFTVRYAWHMSVTPNCQ